MARRVFFSFHFDEDIWRVSQVRNSWVTKDWEANTPIDKASWESVKRQGDDAVKRWINNQLDGTSVTVVLIGAYTSGRKFVNYEIQRSHELRKGLLGVRVHNLKNVNGKTSWSGTNPLDNFSVEMPSAFSSISSGLTPRASLSPFNAASGLASSPLNQPRKCLSEIFKTYDWVNDDGYLNFTSWVDEAAQIKGR